MKSEKKEATIIRKCLKAVAILAVTVAMSGIDGAQAAVLIDFGKNNQTTGTVGGNTWNNSFNSPAQAAPGIANLVDTSGDPTGISLTITLTGNANFHIGGSDVTGVTPTPNAIQYPESATRDQAFNASTSIPAILTLSGLNNSRMYNLTFFGLTPAGTERWTEVTIGATMKAYDSDANNGGGWVTYSNLIPTSGSIAIELDRGGTSGTSIGSALSVMEINIAPIPEAGTSALLMAGFAALAIARRCKRGEG